MQRKILIILGHPARKHQSFCESLALAYRQGAKKAGHEVHFIKLATLQFDPILHEGSKEQQQLEVDLQQVQAEIQWAEHLVLIYPTWNYMLPALFTGFIERTLAIDFAYTFKSKNPFPVALLNGRSARLIQTLGAPTFIYRWLFGSHITKALKNVLKVSGFNPIQATYFGNIDNTNAVSRKKMLDKTVSLGYRGK